MKIILESEKDLNRFIKARDLTNKEVIIDGKVLVKVISGYKKEISDLKTELSVNTNNLVKNWINENIEILSDVNSIDKSDAEIKKEVIDSVKEELEMLKSEADFPDVDFYSKHYNFFRMLSDGYNLTSEEVIKKVEKDLAELEA